MANHPNRSKTPTHTALGYRWSADGWSDDLTALFSFRHWPTGYDAPIDQAQALRVEGRESVTDTRPAREGEHAMFRWLPASEKSRIEGVLADERRMIAERPAMWIVSITGDAVTLGVGGHSRLITVSLREIDAASRQAGPIGEWYRDMINRASAPILRQMTAAGVLHAEAALTARACNA